MCLRAISEARRSMSMPFALNWDAERGAIEGRTKAGWYKFGLGSARDSTWLFAQRAIDLLRPEDAGVVGRSCW